jgi:hypothetical protein
MNEHEEDDVRRSSNLSQHEEFFRRLSEIPARRESSRQIGAGEYEFLKNEPELHIFSDNEEMHEESKLNSDESDIEDALVPLLESNRSKAAVALHNYGKLDIPDSILIYAFEFLPAKNVARISRVSHHFKQFADSKM